MNSIRVAPILFEPFTNRRLLRSPSLILSHNIDGIFQKHFIASSNFWGIEGAFGKPDLNFQKGHDLLLNQVNKAI
jgi:hypothetical protein